MKRTRYFHEDDYCQRELLPATSWDYCASELTKINESSEAHRAPIGWTKMYIRGEAPVRLRDLKLTAPAIESIVGSRLPRYDEVLTGYSTHREPSPRTRAFGTDGGPALYVDLDDDGYVEHAWLDAALTDASVAGWLPALMASLPEADELLFVDWAWGHLQPVADADAWKQYFAAQGHAREGIQRMLSKPDDDG